MAFQIVISTQIKHTVILMGSGIGFFFPPFTSLYLTDMTIGIII